MIKKLLQDIKDSCGTDSVAVFISGGFDSTVLAYTLLHLQIDCKLFTIPRHDDSLTHANRIKDWLNTKWNKNLDITIVGNPDLHHNDQLASGIKDCLIKTNHKIFIANTKNPPVNFPGKAPIRAESHNPRVYAPFNHVDKRTTIKIAMHLNILNDVMNLSHSCTQSKLLRCGQCWQCYERQWAFKELDIHDEGTM